MSEKPFLELFITPDHAAKQLESTAKVVLQMVDEGKVRAAIMTDGSIGISQQSLFQLLPKEALPVYQEYEDLEGIPIRIFEASKKYNISTPTITRWIQRGLINQISKEGRKTFIDEADMAYCARVYQLNKGQGKWVFDEGGRPYHK